METERFKAYGYDELISREKVNLDLTWLRDDSLEDLDNLPAPEIIAREIVEDLSAALEEFAAVALTQERQIVFTCSANSDTLRYEAASHGDTRLAACQPPDGELSRGCLTGDG